MDQDSLRAAVRGAGIEVDPVWTDQTPSTNDEAKALAQGGAPEWTLVSAGHQTAGRGRLGRSWVERPGTSLMFSLVLRPELPPASAPLLSLLAAAVMARACREVTGVEVATKWPNDLVVGERKLAGLLAEARVSADRLDHLVIGVGVNLSSSAGDLPPEVRDTATSLAIEGSAPDAGGLLQRFLEGYRALYRPGHPGFAGEVLASYRGVCATIGRRVRASTTEGRTVEGRAVEVDDDGGLVVESEAGRSTVAFGEIQHLEEGSG